MPVTVNSAVQIKDLPVNSSIIKDADNIIVDVFNTGTAGYDTSLNTMFDLASFMKTKITKLDVGLENVENVNTTTTQNIFDSLDKRFVTDIKLAVLNATDGVNTGDETSTTIISKIGYSPANDILVIKKDTLNDVDNSSTFGIRTNGVGGLFFNNGIVGFANTVSQFNTNQSKFFYNISTGETAFGNNDGQRLSIDSSSITLFDSSDNVVDVGVFSGNIKSIGGVPMYSLSGGDVPLKTINGNSIIGVGDIAISGGILSVFGRTGAVTASIGDYNGSQITTTPTALISGTDLQSNLSSINTLLSTRPTGASGNVSSVPFYNSPSNLSSSTDFIWNNISKILTINNGINNIQLGGTGITKIPGDSGLSFVCQNGFSFGLLPLSSTVSILSGASSLSVGQVAANAGTPVIISAVGAAHTNLANTNVIDVSFNIGRNVGFVAGNRPEQTAFLIQFPTYSAAGASVYTDASTFVINGAPAAGTNVTFTNSNAIWVKSGNTQLGGGLNRNALEGVGGVIGSKSFIGLTAAYTLLNSTALQKIFNQPANGAFVVEANSTYLFRCVFQVSGLSATSGSLSFGFLGTATFTSLRWSANGFKSTSLTNPVASTLMTTSVATASVISPANIGTVALFEVEGVLRINTAGTVIPSIVTSIGVATASVGINSYATLDKIGNRIINGTVNTN